MLSVIQPYGQTTRIDLTTSASSTLVINSNPASTNYVALTNTGTGFAAVEFSAGTPATPAVASTGNAGSFVLPPSMTIPMIVACPQTPFNMKGISSGTNTLFITPVQVR